MCRPRVKMAMNGRIEWVHLFSGACCMTYYACVPFVFQMGQLRGDRTNGRYLHVIGKPALMRACASKYV